MKVGIYTDAHYAFSTSVLPKSSVHGFNSYRLYYLYESMKQMYSRFSRENVDFIIEAGDLIDKSLINSLEITDLIRALEKKPKGILEYNIVGNHGVISKDNSDTITNFLYLLPEHEVINYPKKLKNCNISLLPFKRDSYTEEELDKYKNDIAVSHLDYKGMFYTGTTQSEYGIDMNTMIKYFKLTLNGHIHTPYDYKNGQIKNIGSLSGISFSDNLGLEDIGPCYGLLDTDTLEFTRIHNDYAPMFMTYTIKSESDIRDSYKQVVKYINPMYLRFNVKKELLEKLKDTMYQVTHIEYKRYNIIQDSKVEIEEESNGNSVKEEFITSDNSLQYLYRFINQSEDFSPEDCKVIKECIEEEKKEGSSV